MKKPTDVWLVEREFLLPKEPTDVLLVEREFLPRKYVVTAVPPSASKKDAEMKRELLPHPTFYVVTKYRRVEE